MNDTLCAAAQPPFALSPSLAASLRQLDACQANLSIEQIRLFHDSLQLGPEDLQPFLQFSDERYRRNQIYLSPWCELLLLCWRSTQRSRIHNHRGSLCGLRVLQGAATETVFERTDHGQVYAVGSHRLEAGSLTVNNHLDIHQISNLQPYGADLVTLHLYSPPLRNMELFSLESSQVERPGDSISWVYEI
ncbi:cysteine dioxygenase family protein [Chromobacterium alkanivorans]|uniref:cysteine dioxygenase n=1 Tax=Chromobacterium alkanivorans TaxID=1071719 RepID=UPI001967F347|nr:cysteine dioxygenase family protein [Chromobacterium alkanivorans]MBN3003451.1 cysteine dioxygenase family protein [Chromobacterium alkanivorans]